MLHDVALRRKLGHVQRASHNENIVCHIRHLLHEALKASPVVSALRWRGGRHSRGQAGQGLHMHSPDSSGPDTMKSAPGPTVSQAGQGATRRSYIVPLLAWTGGVSKAQDTSRAVNEQAALPMSLPQTSRGSVSRQRLQRLLAALAHSLGSSTLAGSGMGVIAMQVRRSPLRDILAHSTLSLSAAPTC